MSPTPVDRTAFVAAAAAHDLADEHMILLPTLTTLEPVDPAAAESVSASIAALYRAMRHVRTLQDWAVRHGGRATAATTETVVGLFDARLA